MVKEKGDFLRKAKLSVPAFSLFLFVLFSAVWIPHLKEVSQVGRLTEEILFSADLRRQLSSEEMLELAGEWESPGEAVALYWLESDFLREETDLSAENLAEKRERWAVRPEWSGYVSACRAVWDDVVYFPVAEVSGHRKLKVSFEDSWLFGRSYGGERGHEGTDLMPSVNERGLYPVVSMTDGTVESKGWLELGGYRLGIRAPGGAYFYYAHLDSYADIEEGDQVKAGDLLGYMGDTGYSEVEGTTGNFPVHLHLGIYIYPNGKEISVNPYPVLKLVEDAQIKCLGPAMR